MDIDALAELMFEAAKDIKPADGGAPPQSVEETKAMLEEDPDVLEFFTRFATLCRATVE